MPGVLPEYESASTPICYVNSHSGGTAGFDGSGLSFS